MSYGRMRDEERRLREQIAALTAQADASDAAEDAAHGPDVRGDEGPAELQRREERLATIAAANARLHARQADADREQGRHPDDGRKGKGRTPFARDFGVPPDDAQDNFTDPESRIMKTSSGFDQCYNGQIAVDETTQLIVATGLTNCAADNAELLPLITCAEEPLGGVPPEVLADAGYRGEAVFQTLEARGAPPGAEPYAVTRALGRAPGGAARRQDPRSCVNPSAFREEPRRPKSPRFCRARS